MSDFDQVAHRYIELVERVKSHWLPYLSIVEELRKETEAAGLHICDIGCGPGELTCQLSDLGAMVTGIDSSDVLLAHARAKSGRVNGLRDDAMTLGRRGAGLIRSG